MHLRRLLPLFVAAFCGLLVRPAAAAVSSAPPNFLLIIADDCTYRDLGVYGGQAKTPHLDRLAAEGMKFNRCFQAAPMCSPTRHALYTGLYPVRTGAYPNHTFAHDWVKSVAHHLAPAGYSAHLSGKTHIAPDSVFPFARTRLAGDPNPNPDPAAFAAVLRASAASKKPWLFIAASNEPHTPWNKGDPSAYPPDRLKLPPMFVDTPETRDAFSRYLAEITYFDSQVGQLLAELDRSGQRDQTVVVVLSEQGNSFPFAKWTCYDVGLASGCLVRWPGRIAPGSVSDALVEYVDIVPTFLDAAALPRPEPMDGRSFLSVLTGASRTHKSHVFGLMTTRGINHGSPWFGIRSVRDERYRYILNLTPEAEFKNAAMTDPYYKSWEAKAATGDPVATRVVQAYRRRPAEELYDCESDPWNRTNLAADPRHAARLADLRTRLAAWMKSQGDEGQVTEMKALERMPNRTTDEDGAPTRKKKKA